MLTKNKLIVLATCGLFALCSEARASVIDFEDLLDASFFNDASVNVGTFYPGVTFGPGITGLSGTRFGGYANAAYPSHSGDVVVWSAFDFDATIAFAIPQATVGIWYTSFDFLTLTAFDAANSSLGSALGNPNTDGFLGNSSFLSISAPGISSVVISGLPSAFVFDDVTFSSTAVPEPAFGMLLGVTLAVVVFRRRPCRIWRNRDRSGIMQRVGRGI